MAVNVTIRPLQADDRADWESLWQGYAEDTGDTQTATAEQLWEALHQARTGQQPRTLADVEDALFRYYLPMARSMAARHAPDHRTRTISGKSPRSASPRLSSGGPADRPGSTGSPAARSPPNFATTRPSSAQPGVPTGSRPPPPGPPEP